MKNFAAKLQAAYEAWGESGGRTPDRFMALVTPEIELHSVVDTSLPHVSTAGPYYGKAGIFHYFAKMAEKWEMIEMHTRNIIVGQSSVVWYGHSSWRNLQTLRRYESPKIQIWNVEKDRGLASSVFMMLDTYSFADAMGMLPSPENS
ncbi:nuclear transport factor 2 family protein [Altericroceibacterium spongiae]|uniref:Nuclear transport factor 2 family protein n=1 Tax=Altericroceibacterium spongiae TaxID=2320269 RepID=A0A420EPJ1_9SPHN|nr:nuclear transport factor 2 family protein [Altericroceibacterium spongiae]RKF22593.1 nuclear transport factor 2 family protein [Altericroceibacterium spongiae]